MLRMANDSGSLKRRQMLRLAGTGLLVGGAGCNSNTQDGGGGTTTEETPAEGTTTEGTTTAEGGGEPVDPAFTTKVQQPPGDIQYNPFNPKGQSGETKAVLFEPLVKFDTVSGEWMPVLLEEWSIEGGTLSVAIRDGYTWHDGDPVTARDLATKWKLDLFVETLVADFLEEVEVTGERTLEATLTNDSINKSIFASRVLNTRLMVKHQEFKQHLKAFQDAGTEEETTAAKEELLNRTIGNPVGNGPFAMESSSGQWVRTKKHEGYPGADGINFPTYEFKFLDSNQKRWAALKNDVTDGEAHLGINKDVLQTMPDHVDLIRPPSKGGTSLAFQQNDTVFSDPRVRKAIIYVMNGPNMGKNSTLNYDFAPKALNYGMMPTQVDNWLPKDVRSGFTDYSIAGEEAHSKAASLLRDAGFTKEGDKWMTPDGSRFKAPVMTLGAWWASQLQTLVGQLQAFGIKAQAVTKSLSSFFSAFGDGDFTLAISFFSGRYHPYQGLRMLFGAESGTYAPSEYEVPMPVGDPDGSPETVDVKALGDEILNTRDESKVKQLIVKFSWVYNQTVPRVPPLIGSGMTFLTDDDWNYPKADADVMKIFYPNYWLLRTGQLEAETKQK